MVAADGRRQRTERSRERVLAAVLELLEETGSMPVAQQIADRAGMSVRSVFRLYVDQADLHACALQARVAELRERYAAPDAELSLDDRVSELVATWTDVHEDVSALRRVVMGLLATSEPLRDLFFLGMTFLRLRVESTFCAELDAHGPERDRYLAALDVALSWETWERLRSVQGLSVEEAAATVRLSVSSLLSV